MDILDCSSVESTRASLARILDISDSALDEGLEAHRRVRLGDTLILGREVLARLEAAVGRMLSGTPFQARYFHATRTLAGESVFHVRGLLPLQEVIDGIWCELFTLLEGEVSAAEWTRFRSCIQSELYHTKTKNRRRGGPYGFLIREAALLAPSPSRDYLRRAPEIVEDIGLAFSAATRIDLLSRFEMLSKACLVWFAGPYDPGALAAALEYVYANRYHLMLDGHQWCFNGNGRPVPPNDIVRVEWVST